MPTFTIYRLNFHGALHLSNVREDYGKSERKIHSDTLVAAMSSVLAQIGKPVKEELDFSVSSLFPFGKKLDGTFEYFFPMPLLQIWLQEGFGENAKKLKKVDWLNKSIYESFLLGSTVGDQELITSGEFLHNGKINGPVYTTESLPRVKVPRSYDNKDEDLNQTKIFHMEIIRFSADCGLYFLTNANTEGQKYIESALKVLSLEGFGTDKYFGNGQFDFVKDELTLKSSSSAEHLTNLSLYCPENEAQFSSLVDERTSYELVKRGGWVTSPDLLGNRKKSIYMLKEGSVFKRRNNSEQIDVFGKAKIDLTPPKLQENGIIITRCGQALFIPIKL